jgi:hypothetical protein
MLMRRSKSVKIQSNCQYLFVRVKAARKMLMKFTHGLFSRIGERSSSSGLMVPEQSSLRRHSTGNAAISAAALKSLKDAAAAAEDVKNKLSEQRRPSYGRLPLQQQQQQQQPNQQVN